MITILGLVVITVAMVMMGQRRRLVWGWPIWNAGFFLYDAWIAGARIVEGEWGYAIFSIAMAIVMLWFFRHSLKERNRYLEGK